MSEMHEEMSKVLFDTPYSHLSAWGQREVDNRLSTESTREDVLPKEPESATLLHENEHLSRKLESAQLENLELWEEVTELKSQLAELRAELNLPST